MHESWVEIFTRVRCFRIRLFKLFVQDIFFFKHLIDFFEHTFPCSLRAFGLIDFTVLYLEFHVYGRLYVYYFLTYDAPARSSSGYFILGLSALGIYQLLINLSALSWPTIVFAVTNIQDRASHLRNCNLIFFRISPKKKVFTFYCASRIFFEGSRKDAILILMKIHKSR